MRAEGGPAAAVSRWGAIAATAVGCVAAACLYAAAAPSGVPEAAYWWQPEPVSGLIPVPGVPSNGLYVAASPTGPQAESALRFSVADPTSFVRITLHVSNQERVGRPAVVAYPATSRWQSGGPQPWSARPSYRSTAKPTSGVFSHNGGLMTLTFPAHEAAAGIVLLPDPHASSSAFTVSFAPPRAADVSVRATPTQTPSASSSASASNRPTPRRSHHPARPSSHPTHTHKTHRPHQPSRSPHATRTSSSPSPSETSSPPALPASSSGAGHGGRTAVVVAVPAFVVVLILFWFFRSAARRRPPDPS